MIPIVSVVIPCYNQTEYLDECINSVLSQTFSEYEIIVVNDGSTREIDCLYFNKMVYPKTILVSQGNKGLACARNAGIRRAKGKYILPLDSDDKIAPTFLELAVQTLDKDKCVGIVGGMTRFFGDRNDIMEIPKYTLRRELIANRLVCTHMFRKSDWERVGGYNESMVYGHEDWDFWLSLIATGVKVVQLDQELFYYRRKNVSMITSLNADGMTYKKTQEQIVKNHKALYDNFPSCRNYMLNGSHTASYNCLRLISGLLRIAGVRRFSSLISNYMKNIP